MSDPLAPTPPRKPLPSRDEPLAPDAPDAFAGARRRREALIAAVLGLVAGMILGTAGALGVLAMGFDRSIVPFFLVGGGLVGALAGALSTKTPR